MYVFGFLKPVWKKNVLESQKNVLEGLKVHLMKIILLSYITRKSHNKQKKIKNPSLVTRKFYVE